MTIFCKDMDASIFQIQDKNLSAISDGPDGNSHRDSHDDVDDSYECPAVVVYIINPFSYAAQDWDDLNRLAVIGLLRCYKEVISMLPENMKNNIYLQVSTCTLLFVRFQNMTK